MLPPLSERKPFAAHAHSRPPSLALAALLLAVLAAGHAAVAVREDECEQQRADYPKDWNDVLEAEPLFRCQSHYEGTLLVSIGTPDESGRSIMNLVPIEPEGAAQAAGSTTSTRCTACGSTPTRRGACREGRYFATVVRTEEFLLDPRRPERRSRSSSWTTPTWSRTARRQRILQQGAAHLRLQRGELHVRAGQVTGRRAPAIPGPQRMGLHRIQRASHTGGMPCRDFAPRCS